MNKKQVQEMLDRIPGDEPLFLMRAQDCLADGIVREWAQRAAILRVHHAKVDGALACADKMELWPTRKVPD